ncbi:MAG: hypothetical protein HQL69_23390 [Magnetococcales bacterium]|nr:hypothetical protein [Magnetococcales bacterium]
MTEKQRCGMGRLASSTVGYRQGSDGAVDFDPYRRIKADKGLFLLEIKPFTACKLPHYHHLNKTNRPHLGCISSFH